MVLPISICCQPWWLIIILPKKHACFEPAKITEEVIVINTSGAILQFSMKAHMWCSVNRVHPEDWFSEMTVAYFSLVRFPNSQD